MCVSYIQNNERFCTMYISTVPHKQFPFDADVKRGAHVRGANEPGVPNGIVEYLF